MPSVARRRPRPRVALDTTWIEMVSSALEQHGWTTCTACERMLESETDIGRLEVYARTADGQVQKFRLLCVTCAALWGRK